MGCGKLLRGVSFFAIIELLLVFSSCNKLQAVSIARRTCALYMVSSIEAFFFLLAEPLSGFSSCDWLQAVLQGFQTVFSSRDRLR